MPARLEGKVSLITGGSAGIGRATALAFAREGAKTVIADVDITGGDETVRLIKEAGGEAIFVRTDVSKASEVESLVSRIVETYGRLDCAFNNAGIEGSPSDSIDDFTEDMWDSVLNINLKGVWLCMRYEIPQMLKQGSGSIVNTSAGFGLVGVGWGWGWTAYVASKHGVSGLTRTAALIYAKKGIRVNAVCPGPILTPMLERDSVGDPEMMAQAIATVPMGRLGTPEEIAEAVVWLCSDAATFVTGHNMVVDGGHLAE